MFKYTMYIELLGPVSIYMGIGIQVLVSLFLGALVGFERETRQKAAGIKTNILICLGATLYTTVGMLISAAATGVADPNRIAAQIVSGIGFLGAGAIIQGKGNVTGLTTAATIWVVAAIGYTIGAGYPFSAIFFTVTVLAVLTALGPIYKLIEHEKNNKFYRLDVMAVGNGQVKRAVAAIILNETQEIDEIYDEEWSGKKGRSIITAIFKAHPRQVERMVYEINSIMQVEKVTHNQLEEPPA